MELGITARLLLGVTLTALAVARDHVADWLLLLCTPLRGKWPGVTMQRDGRSPACGRAGVSANSFVCERPQWCLARRPAALYAS